MNVFLFRSASAPKKNPPAAALLALMVLVGMSATHAHADEYGDVNALVRSGKMAEALTKADQYLATKPRDPQMRFLKGVIQTEGGKPAEAIGTFTQITQDYPELPEPYNNLAVLYAGQSQFDKARAALEMAIRTNPSYATAHENLGDVYAKLASQAYSKALQLDSSNATLQPKLTLIRTLFAPDSRAQKAATSPVASGPAIVPAAPVAKAPAPAVAAPAPTAVVAKSPAAPAPAAVVAAAPAAAPATVPTSANNGANDKDIEAAVRAWAAAWSSKDVGSYLGAYGKDFTAPGGQARKAWEEDRRARIVGKSSISVKLNDLVVSNSGSKATATFKQTYVADTLNVTSRKTLELVKTGERWMIVRESTG
jgi:tetratricopeptide (TPR) repeat protein